MIIRCLFDKLVPVSELTPHPKNRNIHSDEQLKRLAKILKYQGWRYPIKVSKQSGLITSGHGRLAAAQINGWEKVPVNFQDYENENQEYADLQSDNAIASWANLDIAKINLDLPELGPEFDIDLLGIKSFTLDPSEKEFDVTPDLNETGTQWIVAVHCTNETQMQSVYQEMVSKGLECKLIT